MTRKLILLDLKNYQEKLKWLIPIYLLIQLFALLFRLFRISILAGAAYWLAIAATVILLPLSLVIVILRYYKNFYSDEAYLTHTLPVTARQKYHAKLMSGFLLYLLATVLTAAGVLLAALSAGIADGRGIKAIRDTFAAISHWSSFLGFSSLFFSILLIVIWLFLYFWSFFVFSFCISLGMSRKLARFGLGAPLLVFIAYYFLNQIAKLIAFLFIPLSYRISYLDSVFSGEIKFVMPFYRLLEIARQGSGTNWLVALEGADGYFDFGLGLFILFFLFMLFSYFFTQKLLQRIDLR